MRGIVYRIGAAFWNGEVVAWEMSALLRSQSYHRLTYLINLSQPLKVSVFLASID